MASRQTHGQPPRGELNASTLRAYRETHYRVDELSRELARRGIASLPGIGQHPIGGWPGEPSLLVPGVGLEEARALAAMFEQNAFLWSGADAVPRLILMNRA